MWNIFREMLRQTRRDKLLWLGAVYLLAMLLTTLSEEFEATATGSDTAVFIMQFFGLLVPIVAGVVAARVCGADLRDKTANYELLFGKKRSQVYFGRFFAALLVTVLTVLVVMLPLPVCMAVKNGWGGAFSFGNTMLHFGLIFPLLFRIVCFYTALSFLCRNDIIPALTAIFGSAVIAFSIFLLQDSGYHMTWETGLSDIMYLLDFSNTTSGFFEGQDITVYKAFLSGGDVIRMLLTSFGIGCGWLFGGLALFRRQDIS